MKKFCCDNCNEEMTLNINTGAKDRKGLNRDIKKRYKIRRFYCLICDISKTIYGDGYYGEHYYGYMQLRNPDYDKDLSLTV